MRILITTILITFLNFPSIAQINRLTNAESVTVDEMIEEEMLLQEIMGISIGIVEDGKIVYTNGYGHEDIDRTKPVTHKTVYNWASISKTLTAVAAFQLIEAGELSLNTPAKSVLDGIWTNPEDNNEITVAHLLSHRSGIRQYNNDKGDDIDANYDAYTDTELNAAWNSRQSVAIFNELKLKSDPGKEFRYSSFAYNLLGAMIDQLDDNFTYESYVTKNILAPLDTKSIDVARKPWNAFSKNQYGAVRSYEEDEKRFTLPAGGWRSNIKDLTIFMNGLINNSLLKRTSALWDEVIVDGSAVDDSPYRYGIEYEYDSLNNEAIIMHRGKHENTNTIMAFYPESKLGFCIMINGGYAQAKRVFRRLAGLFGKPQEMINNAFMSWEGFSDVEKDMTGIWSRGQENSLMRYGYTYSRFEQEKAHLENNGFKIKDCEYFIRDDKLLVGASFVKGKGNHFIPPSSFEDFERQVENMKSKRFQITDLEVYAEGGKVLWSGILSRQLTSPFIVKGLGKEEFLTKVDELKSQGIGLSDFESYISKGKLVWAGIFSPTSEGELVLLQRKDDFLEIYKDFRTNGLGLKDLEMVDILGETHYSGLFNNLVTSGSFRSSRYHAQIASLFNRNAGNNLKLVDLERSFRSGRIIF